MSAPTRLVFLGILLSILMVSIAFAGPDPARERPVVPTPPGGGPGISFAPEDQNLPEGPADPAGAPFFDPRQARLSAAESKVEKALREGDIGGDDVEIHLQPYTTHVTLDVAENGDIYVAVGSGYLSGGMPDPEIRVFRSQDGGDSWQAWGELTHATYGYADAEILVAEGTVDRCFLAYTKFGDGSRKICVAGCDLTLPVGDFSGEVIAMDDPTTNLYLTDFCTDAATWDAYYLYLVGIGTEADGTDIWFARSIDRGVSFESAYEIASLTSSDPNYREPSVAYGFGGYVHVAWHISSSGGLFDSALRYRRAATYANGGLAAWESIQYLASTANGIWEGYAEVGASETDNQVVIAYEHNDPGAAEIGFYGSNDQGATFTTIHVNTSGLDLLADLELQPTTGNWIITGANTPHLAVQRSAGSDITNWGAPEYFAYRESYPPSLAIHSMALDPSRDHQLAVAWRESYSDETDEPTMFDAEWRRDPGYPNLEPGFPVDLSAQPGSDPAVVDLDGDNDLEIIFGDFSGFIHAFHHDGSVVDGWPVAVPGGLQFSPIAIGDLRGNGDMMVVAGNRDGLAYAYEANGDPTPGWPFDTTTGDAAYVSIGALGGPYVRLVAVCAGDRLYFLNHAGVNHHGFYWSYPGHTFNAPMAIGDVDGDGVSEAVGAASDLVIAVHATEPTLVFGLYLPSVVSDAVTLGDLDLDGDMEVVVPTIGAELHVLQGDGSPMAGSWPFVSPIGWPLSSAAFGNLLGTTEPELVFATYTGRVHLAYHDGGEGIGYPVNADYWEIWGMPVIGLVEGSSSDVVIGTLGAKGWAWDNFGNLISGWTKPFAASVQKTPALGDLDLDGSTEIVFVTATQLIVVDINQVGTSPTRTWPMYGHDPQRTGCSDCPEDVTTGIGNDDPEAATDGITRVRFAAPTPNPIAGPTTFSFAVPVRAQVRLEIFDLRGARIATVMREEVGPGQHVLSWDSRDDQGRQLASGQYLARLQVRGPGVDNQLVRKITVLQ